MKSFNILLVFFLVINLSCAQNSQSKSSNTEDFVAYGAKIDAKAVIDKEKMTEKYEMLKAADTIQVKFLATVSEVCQSKGCWMKLELTNGEQTMVRFKDYGFFVPKDIAGKEVVVNGLAFVEEMSVEDQQHYAKDAGKTTAEIAKITQAKKTFGFEADGVLLKEN